MSDFLVRPFRPDDVDAMIDVFQGSIRHVASFDYSPQQINAWIGSAPDRAEWQQRFADHPTFVAIQAGQVVGFSDLQPNGHLDMLYVSAKTQRQGIASALYDAVLTQARADHLPEITVHASLTARVFFERQGFEVVAEQQVQRNGQTLTNFRMRKSL